jgi:methyl-accepting chemotaxis protein
VNDKNVLSRVIDAILNGASDNSVTQEEVGLISTRVDRLGESIDYILQAIKHQNDALVSISRLVAEDRNAINQVSEATVRILQGSFDSIGFPSPPPDDDIVN